MTDERRLPGEMVDNRIVVDVESFDEYFDYFLNEVDKNNLKIVGFNMKWDKTMTQTKQRNKNARKQANGVKFQKFMGEFGFGDSNEREEVRRIRTAKAAYGSIALIYLSSLTGVTLQIRTCLMHEVPKRLVSFLENGEYYKVGYGLRKDMYKLWEELKCQMLCWIDLRNVLMDWKEFRNTYDFRRMGTYSVASFLFDVNFQNSCAAAFSDWYNFTLRREQMEGTAMQTQLDVDATAQMIIHRFKIRHSEDGSFYQFFENLPAQEIPKIRAALDRHKNAQWDQNKYNFSEMPVIRKSFEESERKNLPIGDWSRVRITGEMATHVEKKFGNHPFSGLNMTTIVDEPLNCEQTYLSDDGNYTLTLEIVEVIDEDALNATSTNSSEREIIRRRTSTSARPSYEKALQKVSGWSSNDGEAAMIARRRRLQKLAAKDSSLSPPMNDDELMNYGDLDMSAIRLSDDDDDVVETTEKDEFKTESESLAKTVDIISSPRLTIASPPHRPGRPFFRPPTAVQPPTAIQPARFARFPAPFYTKLGQPVHASTNYPSTTNDDACCALPTNGVVDNSSSTIIANGYLPHPFDVPANSLPQHSTSATSSPTPKSFINSATFGKGRGKLLQTLTKMSD